MKQRPGDRLRAVPPLEPDHSTVQVGQHLRRLRVARGWSIEEAAVQAGLSRNTLSKLEAAALPNPRLATLLALMELYQLRSIEELLGLVPSRELLRAWLAEGRPGAVEHGTAQAGPAEQG
jgi:transcriptional regulator with XRE-family HTH domain